jgi:hypothetical protein
LTDAIFPSKVLERRLRREVVRIHEFLNSEPPVLLLKLEAR